MYLVTGQCVCVCICVVTGQCVCVCVCVLKLIYLLLLLARVHETVSRGGRCLIPVFALGRAQELLLILDEYWAAHPELHDIPIYYASSLAKKCMAGKRKK